MRQPRGTDDGPEAERMADEIDEVAARRDKDRDDAYRAIGRYVVTFSELTKLMRDQACECVAKGVLDMPISSLLLGEATAQVISNAFFGLCRMLGDLDTAEQRVEKVLRNRVNKAIKTRNDLAHGDWYIGLIRLEAGEAKMQPARLVRLLPGRTDGPHKVMDLTVDDIDALSDQVEELLPLVEEFGKLALKLPLLLDAAVSIRDIRVRDVLTVPAGRGETQVVRDGSRAQDVIGGIYSALALQELSTALAAHGALTGGANKVQTDPATLDYTQRRTTPDETS
jgi:hypothetical protein